MADELKKKTRVSTIVDDEVVEGVIVVVHQDGTVSVQLDDVEEILRVDVADVENIDPPEDEDQETITLEQNVTIPKSSVTLDSKSMADPRLLEKEEAKQKELAVKRRKNRVARIKAKPRTPIQVRKAYLAARLGKVKKRMSHTYRKEQLIAWAKELRIIQERPGSWSQGCVRSKKAKTAQDFIDELNID